MEVSNDIGLGLLNKSLSSAVTSLPTQVHAHEHGDEPCLISSSSISGTDCAESSLNSNASRTLERAVRGTSLLSLPLHARGNRQVCEVCVARDPLEFLLVSSTLKLDASLALLAVRGGLPMWYLPDELWEDVKFVIKMVTLDAECLSICRLYGSGKEADLTRIGMAAARRDPQAAIFLARANSALRFLTKDRAFVRACVYQEYDNWMAEKEFELCYFSTDHCHALSSTCLKYADDELKCDPDFLLELVARSPHTIVDAHRSIRDNADVMLKAVTHCYQLFDLVSPALKNDEGFMWEVVRLHPVLLPHAPETLRQSADFCREYYVSLPAGVPAGDVMAFFTPESMHSLETAEVASFVEHAATMKGNSNDETYILERLQEEVRGRDEEGPYAKTIEMSNSRLLDLVDDSLDDTFASLDSCMDGHAKKLCILSHASEALRDSETFMVRALRVTSASVVYASARLLQSRDFLLKAFEETRHIISICPTEYLAEEEFVRAMLVLQPSLLFYVAKRLKGKASFITPILAEIYQKAGKAADVFLFISELPSRILTTQALAEMVFANGNDKQVMLILEHSENRDFALKVLSVHGDVCWGFVNSTLRRDEAFVLSAITANKNIYFRLGAYYAGSEKIVKAYLQGGGDLCYVRGCYMVNREAAFKHVKESWENYRCFAQFFEDDEQLLIAAVRQHPSAVGYAPQSMQADPLVMRRVCAANPDCTAQVTEILRHEAAMQSGGGGGGGVGVGDDEERLERLSTHSSRTPLRDYQSYPLQWRLEEGASNELFGCRRLLVEISSLKEPNIGDAFDRTRE